MTVLGADSLAQYLPPVAARTPPSLVSADTFGQVERVARTLPGALSETFGFECPLGDDIPRADLLVGARSDRGWRGLSALARNPDPHPAVAGLRDFAAAWGDPTSPWGSTLDNVWLEFDIEGPNREVPSVFFGFRPTDPAHGRPSASEGDRQLTATLASVAVLRGREPAPAPAAALRRCFHACPGAQVFQVGVMLGRATDAVRLCLRLRSFDDVPTYLGRVGWVGDVPALQATLEPLAALAEYVCLDVDVGSGVHPKVGLECYVAHARQWRPFLDALVARGLCTSGKHAALLAYPGRTEEEEADGAWPPALSRAARVLGERSASVCLRSLHHVKVVHHPDRPPEAKAYLAVNYRWRAVP